MSSFAVPPAAVPAEIPRRVPLQSGQMAEISAWRPEGEASGRMVASLAAEHRPATFSQPMPNFALLGTAVSGGPPLALPLLPLVVSPIPAVSRFTGLAKL